MKKIALLILAIIAINSACKKGKEPTKEEDVLVKIEATGGLYDYVITEQIYQPKNGAGSPSYVSGRIFKSQDHKGAMSESFRVKAMTKVDLYFSEKPVDGKYSFINVKVTYNGKVIYTKMSGNLTETVLLND